MRRHPSDAASSEYVGVPARWTKRRASARPHGARPWRMPGKPRTARRSRARRAAEPTPPIRPSAPNWCSRPALFEAATCVLRCPIERVPPLLLQPGAREEVLQKRCVLLCPYNTRDQLRSGAPSLLPAEAQGSTSACSTGAAPSFVSCIALFDRSFAPRITTWPSRHLT